MESKKVRDENTRLVEDLIAAVRKRQPILKNPEGLTEDIMKAIRDNSQESKSIKTEKPGEFRAIIILRRLLAAASVCLFLVFGYEEYVVVDKISRLEKQNAAISQSGQYQAALNLKKAMDVFFSDPEMKNRYKKSQTRKLDLQTLLRAAMYVDAAGLSPDALKLMNMADKNTSNPVLLSILEQFDSTDNTLR
jgi:hypothetical protein